MKGVKILTDSTADLSIELLERYDISVIPLHIVLGSQEYEDGPELPVEEIYAWSDQNRTTPKTSAPDPEHTENILRTFLDKGREIICFSIASGMSTSGNVIRLAAEAIGASDKVFVVDSANLSTGIGLLAIEAAIMARQGHSRQEILLRIEALRPKVRASFVVDTLTYLHRGGRCSGLALLAGSALKLHPKIVVVNGAMRPDKKYRGKLERVLIEYVQDMEEQILRALPDRVFITHSGCDDQIVQAVREKLESLHVFEEICITHAGSVVSSHCGPNTLGVLFIDGE